MVDSNHRHDGIILAAATLALTLTGLKKRPQRDTEARGDPPPGFGRLIRDDGSAKLVPLTKPSRGDLPQRVDTLDLAVLALLLGETNVLAALGVTDPATFQALADQRTRQAGSLLPWTAVLLGAYTKDPLQLGPRKRIYERVKAFPGLHLSEIARKVEMDTNHAKYHLRVLEDNDLVSSRREDGYWRFYPRTESNAGKREVLQPDEKRWLSLLRRPVPLKVSLVLAGRRTAPASEISEALDIAPSTLHYHASKMEEAGLIESSKEGRQRVYRLAEPERVLELISTHEPPDELTEGFLEGWDELELEDGPRARNRAP